MKRSKKLLILAGVLAVTAAAYLVTALAVRISDEKSQVTVTEGTYALASWTAADVSSLSWKYNGETFTLKRNGESWSFEGDDGFTVDSSVADTMLENLATLTADRLLTGGLELSEYGLEQPSAEATVTLNNGSSITYKTGDRNEVTGEYYTSVDAALYLSATSLSSAFNKNRNSLYLYDTIPDMSLITSLTLSTAENTFEICALEDGSAWDYTSSHTYFLKQENRYIPLDNDLANALLEEARTLSWTALQEYGADETALNDTYGFASPTCTASVTYTENGETKVFTLEIGGAYSSYYYYARLPGSSTVYRIDDDLGDLALAFTLNGYLDREVVGIESINEMSVTIGEKAWAFRRTTDDSGTKVFINDAETDTQAYDSLCTAINALAATEFTDDNCAGEPLMTCVIATENDSISAVQLSFYDHDADSYLCVRSDGFTMTVDAAGVDSIIRMVKTAA